MTTRELKHPKFEIEGHDEGVLLRFFVPGSTFGSVEIALALDEAYEVASSIEEAAIFEEGSS